MLRSCALTLMALLPLSLTATALGGVKFDTRSARSGLWSDPGTWEGGRAPRRGDRVQVRAGHQVTYDVVSEEAIRSSWRTTTPETAISARKDPAVILRTMDAATRPLRDGGPPDYSAITPSSWCARR